MGEVFAERIAWPDVRVALDEPYQHYQFAGRGDVVAWSLAGPDPLHIENRTRFPNLQDAFGSYNAKRRGWRRRSRSDSASGAASAP